MTLFVVTGPPCAGKTTWVREHAKPGDITIDYDAIVDALTPRGTEPYDAPAHVVDVAQAARNAAIHAAANSLWHRVGHAYIIDSKPSAEARQRHEQLGAQFVDIDPGYETCAERARTQRHPRIQQVIDRWYADALAH